MVVSNTFSAIVGLLYRDNMIMTNVAVPATAQHWCWYKTLVQYRGWD